MYDKNLWIRNLLNAKLSDLHVNKQAGKDVRSVSRQSLHRQIQRITSKPFKILFWHWWMYSTEYKIRLLSALLS